MKRLVIILGLVALAGLVIVIFMGKQAPVESTGQTEESSMTDPKNATYRINDETVVLTDGVSTVAVPGSSMAVVTRYFGNELVKDVDGDGREDTVFLLTQETGGSGTFFYVVAALNTPTGYVGSEALFLGDRIAPQTTESGPGRQVIVNYAERAPEESFSTPPSIGKTIRLLLDIDTLQFGEVVADFEGEADPAVMTLGMKTWVWQRAAYNDGREVLPSQVDAFTLTFREDGAVEIGTDCNSAGGNYTATAEMLMFSALRSTLRYCEGSQEADFLRLLTDTATYHFTSRGELVLGLKYDSGSVVFK